MYPVATTTENGPAARRPEFEIVTVDGVALDTTRSAGPVRAVPAGSGAAGLGGRILASAVDANVDVPAITASVRPVARARRIPLVLMNMVFLRLMVE